MLKNIVTTDTILKKNSSSRVQFKKGISVYIIVAILGIFICIYRAETSTNPLDRVIFHSELIYSITHEFKGICWWPITHFIMYLCLGIVAPKYWWLWFLLGVVWEIIENKIGKVINKKEKEKEKNDKYMYGNNWVQGSYTDILFNSLGLILGMIISKFLSLDSKLEEKSPVNPYLDEGVKISWTK